MQKSDGLWGCCIGKIQFKHTTKMVGLTWMNCIHSWTVAWPMLTSLEPFHGSLLEAVMIRVATQYLMQRDGTSLTSLYPSSPKLKMDQ